MAAPWTDEDKHRGIKMRRACVHPRFIASTLNRTEAAVRIMLSQTGIEFPMLRRGHLKWDKSKVEYWIRLNNQGLTYGEIAYFEKTHISLISKKICADFHGEMMY